MTTPIQDQQELYKSSSEATRAHFAADRDQALNYYRDLVEFVVGVAPSPISSAPLRLLDVGCGCGWSSFAFAQANYETHGIDLNAEAFEPPSTPKLTLSEASALNIPFEADTFHVVCSYQCIEHVPDPEKMLCEMLRVCRPGGILCVVGPNLLSPFLPIKLLARSLARRDMQFKRTKTLSRHPYGNTLPELLASVPVTTGRLTKKALAKRAMFTMRVPDTRPPFHGDNDACYLCNPTDLMRYFTYNGCDVIQNGKPGRPPLSYLFAGGTWIAARKRG